MFITAEDAATMGKDGGHAGNRARIEGLTEEDDKTILYFALFPNALVSMHPDYVMLHTLYPRARPDRGDLRMVLRAARGRVR